MTAALQPMLASLMDAPLDDPAFVYEPKYDGIRAIVEAAARGGDVRLWSRLGNEKTPQFPEIVEAVRHWTRAHKTPLVLDGEIVALDAHGDPTGFQHLQGRIHLGGHESGASRHAQARAPRSRKATRDTAARSAQGTAPASVEPVALIVFDLLRDGATDYRDRALRERRAALERLFARSPETPLVRISAQARGDGRALYQQALARGWEGLIAKHADSLYKSGKRTPDWRKLKLVREQEFVVGGWTEPRQSRPYFGALLLGVHEDGDLVYVGHTGTGFNDKELARVMALLTPREIPACPFKNRPKTNERPHWVTPDLVAEIKFTEWTADAKLRHPVYLGLRDDKKAADVRREDPDRIPVSRSSPRGARRGSAHQEPTRGAAQAADDLVNRLSELEKARKDGTLTLPDGDTLPVTNLHKIFWPKERLTKGDLFRYYVRAAPFILPAVADRPLVMKRFPNGVGGAPFYQHRAPEVPSGVRTAVVSVVEKRPQIIGGSLKALLYMTQLAAISQDPWFSRVQHPQFADYAALDLDPSEGVPFARALDVARWIRDELDALGATAVPKTSGADGLHIYVPLPPGTPYDAGLLFSQIVATVVAHKHPRVATVERSVGARGARVYIDCLQNILGKTLATAYSARASDFAGVSTPLTWREVDDGIDRREFTIASAPARFEAVGDLWAALRRSKGVDLTRVARYAERSGAGVVKGDKS